MLRRSVLTLAFFSLSLALACARKVESPDLATKTQSDVKPDQSAALVVSGQAENVIKTLDEAAAAAARDDIKTAIKLIRPLAEGGNPAAQHYLASLYDLGYGVPQDWEMSVNLDKMAAEQGYWPAQFALGLDYGGGPYSRGLGRNSKEACKWLSRAAEQGHTTAQTVLATYLENGDGIMQDFARAHMWLNIAATRATLSVTRQTAEAGRQRLQQKMSAEQITAAHRLAREWKPRLENPSNPSLGWIRDADPLHY